MTDSYLDSPASDPIDALELFLLNGDWSFERSRNNEILLSIKGNYCEYNITIHWNPEQHILHFAFVFHVGLPKDNLNTQHEMSLLKLVSLLNENMAVGHFDLWREENAMVWRCGQVIFSEQLPEAYFDHILQLALQTCERYYSSFQFVLWANQSPEDALQNLMFETAGNA